MPDKNDIESRIGALRETESLLRDQLGNSGDTVSECLLSAELEGVKAERRRLETHLEELEEVEAL